MEEAQAERNKHKNRDPKVLPVSRYRVFFTSMRDGSNPYFNAVPVKGYKAEYSTYATQVPLQATVPLFWKFVLESKFKSIVCLQNSTDGVEWFPKKEPQIQADSISITTTGETEKSDIKMYDLRILDQTDSGSETEAVYSNMSPQDMGQGEAAEVRLFMPQNWADQPLTKRPAYRLMNLREEVIRWQGQKDDLPVLVVCRNGAYETGLYVAFNYLLDMLNCEHEVDVTQVVKQIRVTRPQFIASKEQYHFLHSMISDVAPNNTYSNT